MAAQTKPVSRSPLRTILGRLRRAPRPREVPERLRPVVSELLAAHPKADLDPVIRAYQVADEVHADQLRLSGEPFITHPVAVAEILAGMGMDPTTIVGALLHDAVEDTDASIEDLRTDFGSDVAEIIDGLTKIAKMPFSRGRSSEINQAENYRKMMVAMARDVRVIIIKLADRLHNMRTLDPLPPEKRELKARETLEVFVPLASRLGMFQVRTELEDLAFSHLYSKRFREISDLTEARQPERDAYLREVLDVISSHLEQAKIRAEVSGRAKNFYSIYQKMVERGREFDDIMDLVGVRIVVDDLRDCYAALGVIHALWKPLPGRFKDYIAMPKFNMYQSLHTTVMGSGGKPLEIQIRTRAMHESAEFGIAAHWKYKEDDGKKTPRKDSDVPWLGEIVETFREAKDPREFMESLRLDLFHDEVFCFTPKGQVICLPRAASPIDFAYAIHTEVGHRTMGARVNGNLVPLDTRLESGDVVEILTTRAQDARPKEDWLALVKTSRARSRIRHWLTAHRREAAREEGRDLFLKTLRREGIAQAELTIEAWRDLFSELKTSGEETLYEALGEGRLPVTDFVDVLKKVFRPEEAPPPERPEFKAARQRPEPTAPSVLVKGDADIHTKLALCCAPVPGDEIIGFITRGRGVSVHRADCPNVPQLVSQPERLVEVEWDSTQGGRFTVVLQVAALDRAGLLRDISDTLTDCGVMIHSSSSWSKRDGTAQLRFAFELADIGHLDHIQRTVRRVEGVFDTYRVLPVRARAERA